MLYYSEPGHDPRFNLALEETLYRRIRPGDDGDCRRFWEIWTAKEALFKLTGKGPLLALSRFSLPAGVTLDYTAQKGCALTIAAQIL